jgi:hypothetical protein
MNDGRSLVYFGDSTVRLLGIRGTCISMTVGMPRYCAVPSTS